MYARVSLFYALRFTEFFGVFPVDNSVPGQRQNTQLTVVNGRRHVMLFTVAFCCARSRRISRLHINEPAAVSRVRERVFALTVQMKSRGFSMRRVNI